MPVTPPRPAPPYELQMKFSAIILALTFGAAAAFTPSTSGKVGVRSVRPKSPDTLAGLAVDRRAE